jgi:hypothetical protein
MSTATLETPPATLAPDAPVATAPPVNLDALRAKLAESAPAFWATASEQQRTALAWEAHAVVEHDGLDWDEYAEGLNTFGEHPNATDYLAESWSLLPDGAYVATFKAGNGFTPPPVPPVASEATVDDVAPEAIVDDVEELDATPESATKTLDTFERICRSAADVNYDAARTGHKYVCEYLAAGAKTTRSTAVANLCEAMGRHDDAAFLMEPDKARDYLRTKVNLLLRAGAAARLLGDGRGIAKGDGTVKGRSKRKTDSPLPWSIMVELSNLVWREESDRAERWSTYPSITDDSAKLVGEICASGMSRADVVKAVAELRWIDAGLEVEAAEKSGDSKRLKAAKVEENRWEKKAGIKAAPPVVDPKPEPAPAPAVNATTPAPEPAPEPAVTPPSTTPSQTTPETPPATLAPDSPSETTAPAPAPDATPDASPEPDATVEGEEGAMADDEAPDADEPPEPEQAPECRQPVHLIRSGASGAPKDVASMLLTFVQENATPDDVMIDFLALVGGCGDFGNVVRDACRKAHADLRQHYGAGATDDDAEAA